MGTIASGAYEQAIADSSAAVTLTRPRVQDLSNLSNATKPREVTIPPSVSCSSGTDGCITARLYYYLYLQQQK